MKSLENSTKRVKIRKLQISGIFVNFSGELRHFFIKKLRLLLHKYPGTTNSLLKVSNILSHQVYRKFDENCIEALKI